MMSDKSQEILKLKQKLAELEQAQKTWEGLPKDQRIAELLHKKLCHHNHTDQCDWCYESWDELDQKKYSVRKRWLEKAHTILQITDYETAIKVISEL